MSTKTIKILGIEHLNRDDKMMHTDQLKESFENEDPSNFLDLLLQQDNSDYNQKKDFID